jgi:heme/copper-type cytochrome/quinol oxidase subunit 2
VITHQFFLNKLYPKQINVRWNLLASASDVLSSWAVPSFGLKFDACTGGLNQVNSLIK